MELDKRYLWLLYAFSLAIPILSPIGLPISIDETTRATYDFIESIESGSTVAFYASLGGVTLPEQYPTAKMFIQHLFQKDVKIIFLTFSVESPVWQEKIMSEIDTSDKEYGVDYVYLGYTAGGVTAITLMASNLPALVQLDYFGTPFDELPNNGAILEGRETAADFDALFLVMGSDYKNFLGPWTSQYGIPTVLGVQSVNVPTTVIYWESKQIEGLIKGARGNAEYEIIIRIPGESVAAMDAQSLAHIVVLGLIIVGNLKYYYFDKKTEKRRM